MNSFLKPLTLFSEKIKRNRVLIDYTLVGNIKNYS